MAQNNDASDAVQEANFGFDSGHEFQIVRVSPDGFEVTIEYTSDRERHTVQRNRFYEQNGELRLA